MGTKRRRDHQWRWVLPVIVLIAGLGSFVWYWQADTLLIRVVSAVVTAGLWVTAYVLLDRRYDLPGRIILPAILGVAGVLALLLAIPFNPPPPPDCFDAIDHSRSAAAVEVDLLYCETSGTNIWEPDSPIMLEDNKQLVVDNFERLMWSVNGAAEPMFLESTVADGTAENIGYKLSHIYEMWPEYEGRAFMVLGSVVRKNQFANDGERADWVFQLGTKRDPSQVMFVRIIRDAEWEPEAAEDCPQVLAELVPIARGAATSSSPGAPVLDTVYGLGTTFMCIPPDFVESLGELYDSLPPELKAAFDEGASTDSH